ncbi:MAG: ABC transporter ATP-binding protein [Gammaproteobacteria bacterium]|nr:ABC transporter ATP-binding protein [Gammaproteobacteria bacterium]
MFPIDVRGLRKSYQSTEVLHGIDLQVPAGSVFALLGRNGAGKSTTMRLLLGLLDADAGDIRVVGQRMPAERLDILRDVGSMIEQPSLYESLSARENLRIDASLRGLGEAAIDKALEVVELDAGAKPVKHYSMGMKQRLALALAVLGEPKLLLLDEPTNGLDPMGIADMRRLLRSLPERLDTTVLLSTHLLGEVEQVASHLCVLEAGEIRYTGTLDELKAREPKVLRLQCDDIPHLYNWLGETGHEAQLDTGRASITVPVADTSESARLLRRAVQEGFRIHHASFESRSLEEIYFDMIGRDASGLLPVVTEEKAA